MAIHKQLNRNFVWNLTAAAMSMPPLEFYVKDYLYFRGSRNSSREKWVEVSTIFLVWQWKLHTSASPKVKKKKEHKELQY